VSEVLRDGGGETMGAAYQEPLRRREPLRAMLFIGDG